MSYAEIGAYYTVPVTQHPLYRLLLSATYHAPLSSLLHSSLFSSLLQPVYQMDQPIELYTRAYHCVCIVQWMQQQQHISATTHLHSSSLHFDSPISSSSSSPSIDSIQQPSELTAQSNSRPIHYTQAWKNLLSLMMQRLQTAESEQLHYAIFIFKFLLLLFHAFDTEDVHGENEISTISAHTLDEQTRMQYFGSANVMPLNFSQQQLTDMANTGLVEWFPLLQSHLPMIIQLYFQQANGLSSTVNSHLAFTFLDLGLQFIHCALQVQEEISDSLLSCAMHISCH